MNRLLLFTGAALLVAAAPSAIWAQDSTLTSDRWSVKLGAFLSDFDTTLRLSGPERGTEINLEDVLGLETDNETFRGEVSYRIADRHRVSLGYYSFSRSASAAASRDFVIETEDQTLEFSAGAAIQTSFDWTLVPLIYRYSFHQSDRMEASIGVGVHWAEAEVSLSGQARINEMEFGQAVENEKSSAPLPVASLDVDYAVTDRFRLGATASYFGIKLGDIEGSLTDIRLTSDYRWTRSFSTGLGYTWYDINYEDSNGDFEFDLEYTYRGPEAYLAWRF